VSWIDVFIFGLSWNKLLSVVRILSLFWVCLELTHFFQHSSVKWAGLTCSMFGVWGSRTEGGRLFTGRNLDWLKDTGTLFWHYLWFILWFVALNFCLQLICAVTCFIIDGLVCDILTISIHLLNLNIILVSHPTLILLRHLHPQIDHRAPSAWSVLTRHCGLGGHLGSDHGWVF
jgi:hypothetical protein